MAKLLWEAVTRGIFPDFASQLLARLEPGQRPGADAVRSATSERLVEPLTERETDVLRLLVTHLTSTEIAQRLYVSPNTTRYHIKHIYAKLGVHSRSDAVQRARELGLL